MIVTIATSLIWISLVVSFLIGILFVLEFISIVVKLLSFVVIIVNRFYCDSTTEFYQISLLEHLFLDHFVLRLDQGTVLDFFP